MLKNKTVVVGVCGGIAAYKTCDLVSRLKKSGADVHVIMTNNATQFVAPLTFETLSANRVSVDTFSPKKEWEVAHVALAKRADLFVIAPATANFIGKYANGIADDMLTTTVMATHAPVLIAPAMNTGMLESDSCQSNLKILRDRCDYPYISPLAMSSIKFIVFLNQVYKIIIWDVLIRVLKSI